MNKVDKSTKRLLAARYLHVGCNVMDSVRVTTWLMSLALRGVLTEKEHRLIEQRALKSKEMIGDVRKIANHIERHAR